jgi:hypothetical protein
MLDQPGVAEHAIDAGGTDRDHIRVEHHEGESPVTFEGMAPVKLEDGHLLPRLKPPVARDQGIVLVGQLVARLSVVERPGRDPEPGDEPGDGNLGSPRRSPDEVHDAIAGVVENPSLGQSSPSSFFGWICSSISSAPHSCAGAFPGGLRSCGRTRSQAGRSCARRPRIYRRRAVLPEVEQRRRELILVAEIGDGNALDQMAPQDGDLLNRRIVLAGLSHGETPAEL